MGFPAEVVLSGTSVFKRKEGYALWFRGEDVDEFIDEAREVSVGLRQLLVEGGQPRGHVLDARPGGAIVVDLRTDLDGFKTENGFALDPNTASTGEVTAQFANSGDLGFGRDMHCRVTDATDGHVACYVVNYGFGYGAGATDDQDDANAAGERGSDAANPAKEVATVAMEYSPMEGDAVVVAGGEQGLEDQVALQVPRQRAFVEARRGRCLGARLRVIKAPFMYSGMRGMLPSRQVEIDGRTYVMVECS